MDVDEKIYEERKRANNEDLRKEREKIRAINTDKAIYFNFSYAALKMLGKNLYNNPLSAVSELVANGIDAKAKNIYVYIDMSDKQHSVIEIIDDGIGMNYEDLAEKYVWIGRNKREEESLNKDDKSALMGRKGIGKLAALYLSNRYYIFSKRESVETQWTLNVTAYRDSDFPKLDRLEINKKIASQAIWSKTQHGTAIILENVDLRRTGSKRIEGLKRNLSDYYLIDAIETKIWVAVVSKKGQTITYDPVNKNVAYKNFCAIFDNSGYNISSKIRDSISYTWLSTYEHIQKKERPTIVLNASDFETSGKAYFSKEDGTKVEKTYNLSGWIGIHATIESKDALDKNFIRNDIYQPNNLRVYVRNKLAVANYFDLHKSTQTMANYIEGEISFDILDDDDLPDIATSSRQDFLDDERVEILIELVEPIVRTLFKLRNKIGQTIREENDKYTKLLQEIERKKREAEKAAREKAEEEARREAAERVKAEERAREANERAEAERKRSQYILSISSIDDKNVMNAIHSIYNKATRIKDNIDDLYNLPSFPREGIKQIEKISLSNQYVLYLSKPISKAGYVIENNDGSKVVNLTKFIKEYFDNVLSVEYSDDIKFELCGNIDSEYEIKIKPLSFVMVIENIIGNSIKAGADKIIIDIHNTNSEYSISFIDNGEGISSKINDVNNLFDFGVTTTSGSGLGLFYARKYMKELKGTINIQQNIDKGVNVNLHWNY